MGTNYYHRLNACDCCGRYDERHIGKSLVMFQGYRPDPDWPGSSTPTITSWAHWRDALRADGEVWSECGYRIDTEQFIADVEATNRPARRRQYDWVVRDARAYGHTPEHDWLDADGFSFTDTEFT